jgi:PKD repeat protein
MQRQLFSTIVFINKRKQFFNIKDMKKLAIILILLVQMGVILAQNLGLTISGQVLSSNNLSPIPNQPVAIQVMYNSALTPVITTIYTASDGSYSFNANMYTQTATVYLSTTNNYGVPSTALYNVTMNSSTQSASVNHIFYIDDDSIPSNCTAYYSYAVQYPDSLTLNFTNQSYEPPTGVNYSWSFGDGTSSNLENPVHTYAAYGYYQVCLTIYDTLCQSTFCDYILIGQLPNTNNPCSANFTSSNDPQNPGIYNFTDLSTGNPSAWMWNFGDGTTSTLQNPSHTYTTNGIYTVTLTISNFLTQCSSSVSHYVSVDSIWTTNCQSAFSWQSGNVPYNVGFYDFSMGTNIQSWYWTFGDGTTSTQQHPFHSYAAPGLYQVCLTITCANNCTSTWCNMVNVDSLITCTNYFTYQTSGTTILFNGFHTGAANVYYQWSFGDGTTGNGQQITHTYSASGTYYVSLISTDTVGCTAVSSQVIVVSGGVFNQIYGQVFAGNFPIPQGYVLLFSDDVAISNNSYFDVTAIDSMGIYIFPQVPNGDYYILAVPFNQNGYLPTYYGDAIDWESATIVSIPPANNPYNIYLEASTGSQVSGIGEINGTVHSNSIASNVFTNMKVLLYDENQNPITYAGTETNMFTFSNLGFNTYYLQPQLPGFESELTRITVNEQNPTIHVQINVEGTQLILNVQDNNHFAIKGIFPNPSSDVMNISLYSLNPQNNNIKIIDVNGKVVYEMSNTVSAGDNSISLDLKHLSEGIYFVQITTENGEQSTQKWIKK